LADRRRRHRVSSTAVALPPRGNRWLRDQRRLHGRRWLRDRRLLRGSRWLRDRKLLRGSRWLRDRKLLRGLKCNVAVASHAARVAGVRRALRGAVANTADGKHGRAALVGGRWATVRRRRPLWVTEGAGNPGADAYGRLGGR